jgi:hypothetical protein
VYRRFHQAVRKRKERIMKSNIISLRNRRAVHLIDAENLVGGPLLSQSDVLQLRARYMASVPVGAMDQIIIATAHNSVIAVGAAWPGLRYEMRSGKDGADICLARIVVDEHLAERFGTVYFGSGDGGLAPFAAHLARQGARVTAVSRIGSLSRHMRVAASAVIYIDRPGIAVARAA